MNGENEGNYLFYSLLAVQKVIRKTMGHGEYHQLIKANSVSLIEKKKKDWNREYPHKDKTILSHRECDKKERSLPGLEITF